MIDYSALLQSIRRMQAIADSAQETQRFVKRFLEENELIARLYKNRIRKYLANRGWYVAGSLCGNEYPALAKAIKENRHSEVEEFLQSHVRSRVQEIQRESSERWPDRARIMNDAFEVHLERKYTLSIPVFLAQADGICYEILEAFLFTDRSGKVVQKVKELQREYPPTTPLAGSFLGLLLEASGLREDTGKRDEFQKAGISVSPLNRHGVLHEIDSDYGTKSNSLRSISLLSFLAEVDSIVSKKGHRDS